VYPEYIGFGDTETPPGSPWIDPDLLPDLERRSDADGYAVLSATASS